MTNNRFHPSTNLLNTNGLQPSPNLFFNTPTASSIGSASQPQAQPQPLHTAAERTSVLLAIQEDEGEIDLDGLEIQTHPPSTRPCGPFQPHGASSTSRPPTTCRPYARATQSSPQTSLCSASSLAASRLPNSRGRSGFSPAAVSCGMRRSQRKLLTLERSRLHPCSVSRQSFISRHG